MTAWFNARHRGTAITVEFGPRRGRATCGQGRPRHRPRRRRWRSGERRGGRAEAAGRRPRLRPGRHRPRPAHRRPRGRLRRRQDARAGRRILPHAARAGTRSGAVLATRLSDEAARAGSPAELPDAVGRRRRPVRRRSAPLPDAARHASRGRRRHVGRAGRGRGGVHRPGVRRRRRADRRRRGRRPAPAAGGPRPARRRRLPGRRRRDGGRAAQRRRRAGRGAAGRGADLGRLRRLVRRPGRAARDAQLLRARRDGGATSTTASAPACSPPGWPAAPRARA